MIHWFWLIPAALVPAGVCTWLVFKYTTRFFEALCVVHYRAQGMNTAAVMKAVDAYSSKDRMDSAWELMWKPKRSE